MEGKFVCLLFFFLERNASFFCSHIEFVAEDNLGWGVVVIVVRLVVLVPVKSGDDPIEVARFSGTVLVLPEIDLMRKKEQTNQYSTAICGICCRFSSCG